MGNHLANIYHGVQEGEPVLVLQRMAGGSWQARLVGTGEPVGRGARVGVLAERLSGEFGGLSFVVPWWGALSLPADLVDLLAAQSSTVSPLLGRKQHARWLHWLSSRRLERWRGSDWEFCCHESRVPWLAELCRASTPQFARWLARSVRGDALTRRRSWHAPDGAVVRGSIVDFLQFLSDDIAVQPTASPRRIWAVLAGRAYRAGVAAGCRRTAPGTTYGSAELEVASCSTN